MELMPKTRFGKIGVLMGGPSSEREISLKSGKAVYQTLSNAGYATLAIDIRSDNAEENIRLLKSQQIDCAFLALHGRFGEDGQIQGLLDNLKIPYTGSGVRASKLAMDKVASRQIFQKHGLNVPKYSLLDKNAYHQDHRINPAAFPLVVKPATQGSSIGLSIVEEDEALAEAVDAAFSFDDRILIEEYIRGREVTVGILEEQALPVIEITPKKKFFDYEAKYQAGMTEYTVPAKLEAVLTEKVRGAGLCAHRLLGCVGCSRVDIILSAENIPFVLEVNTIPGLTQMSLLPKAAQTAGIDFLQLCLKLIELAYAKEKTH